MSDSETLKVANQSSKATVSKPELEVPEGGWAWLSVFTMAMSKMAFWGALPCFGIVYADVLNTLPQEEGKSVNSILGIFTITLDITSVFCPALYRRFSYRQVGTVGGLLYLAGSLGAAFSTSVTELFFTYGVIQGPGYGLMLNACLAAFNENFQRRRTLAMAVAQCANGACSLALPMGARALQTAAGSRAAKLAFSALSAAAAASQLLLRSPRAQRSSHRVLSAAEAEQHHEPLAGMLLEGQANNNGDVGDKENFSQQTANSGIRNTKRKGCWHGTVKRLWMHTGLHVSLLRNPSFVLLAAGIGMVHVLESSLFAMLPLHLRSFMDKESIAVVVTVATAGDLAGRLLMVVVGPFMGDKNRLVFGSAAFTAGVAIVALALTTSWTVVLVLVVMLGVGKGMLYVTMFLAVAEIVRPSYFPSAAAFIFLFQLGASVVISPLLGIVRDETTSYPTCFCVLAGLMCLCPLTWVLDVMRLRFRKKRHVIQREGKRATSSYDGKENYECGTN